jgi:hypothetical protein
MSDTDQLSAELRELRDRSAGVIVPAAPGLAAITARGRRHQRRRRYVVAGCAVAGATAATAVALNLVSASAPATGPDGTTSATTAPVRIETAAFTIKSNPDGTVALTIDPNELFDPSTLENDLALYGIPALVTEGTVCSSEPAPAGLDRVESFEPGGPGENGTITIDPAAMPDGSKLSFGTVDLKGGVRASYSSLIDAGAYTCTATPPNDAEDHGARQGFITLTPTK